MGIMAETNTARPDNIIKVLPNEKRGTLLCVYKYMEKLLSAYIGDYERVPDYNKDKPSSRNERRMMSAVALHDFVVAEIEKREPKRRVRL